MKRIFFFLFLILPALILAGEPTDLGNNLAYLRVHSLTEAAPALQSALAVKHACVLDLRYATANDESIIALKTALEGHPAESPLFILVSPETPAALVGAISPSTKLMVVTLGVVGSQPSPKITVKTDAETDRRAYEAFDKGTPLTELISGKIDKDRYDEATLVHEFKNGNTEAEPPLTPDPTKSKGTSIADKTTEPTADVPEPLKDRVLQRALNLHQALLALRR
jgi:hypothetical protein